MIRRLSLGALWRFDISSRRPKSGASSTSSIESVILSYFNAATGNCIKKGLTVAIDACTFICLEGEKDLISIFESSAKPEH